jgi:hypothetical protein
VTVLNIYGDLLGWIPGWVWAGLVIGLVVSVAWMWLRIRGTSGRGTLQQQRDRSSQWAGRMPRCWRMRASRSPLRRSMSSAGSHFSAIAEGAFDLCERLNDCCRW